MALAAPAGMLLSIFLLYILYVKLDKWQRRRRSARLHGTKPVRRVRNLEPILGLDHLWRLVGASSRNRFLAFFHEEHFKKYGHTFEMNLVGHDLIITNEPRNVQAVLASQFEDFAIGPRRRAHSKQLVGIGLLNADGPVWKHSRALARPNFAREQLDLNIFERHLQVWFKALPPDGSPFDWQTWAFRFTLDVSSEFFFGEAPGILNPDATELSQVFAWAFDVTVDGISKRIRLGVLSSLYYDPDYNRACKVVHDYVDRLVEDATARYKASSERMKADGRYRFLDALIAEGQSTKETRNQMLSILLGGRDTTACLMSAAFWEISRRPDIQAKLRIEVTEQLQGRHPTIEDCKNLTYLNWVLKETLRLYPPAPVNTRMAVRDTFLPRGGGPNATEPIFVAKGQEVMWQIWSMHRREDLWGEDASEFRPERWATKRPHFEYLPFNAGPRICIGQQYATVEACYVLARFLQEFSHIEGVNTEKPWTEKLTLTCSLAQGTQVKLRGKPVCTVT